MIESNMMRHADYDIEYRITEVEVNIPVKQLTFFVNFRRCKRLSIDNLSLLKIGNCFL